MTVEQSLAGFLQFEAIKSGTDTRTECVVILRRQGVQFVRKEHSHLQAADGIGIHDLLWKGGPVCRTDEAERLGAAARSRARLGGCGHLRDRGMIEELLERNTQTVLSRT